MGAASVARVWPIPSHTPHSQLIILLIIINLLSSLPPPSVVWAVPVLMSLFGFMHASHCHIFFLQRELNLSALFLPCSECSYGVRPTQVSRKKSRPSPVEP